jgi:hypothetical protein
LTLKVFEDPPEAFQVADEAMDPHREESREVLAVVLKMTRLLDGYASNLDINRIKAFEKAKDELAELRGIGAFWAAVMNIKLNSISLLDPRQGIKESVAVCEDFVVKLRTAIRKTIDQI